MRVPSNDSTVRRARPGAEGTLYWSSLDIAIFVPEYYRAIGGLGRSIHPCQRTVSFRSPIGFRTQSRREVISAPPTRTSQVKPRSAGKIQSQETDLRI